MLNKLTNIPQQCGIYEILHLPSGRRYVGQSVNIRRRMISHLCGLKKYKHSNSFLQKHWTAYGPENFEFNVLELCDKSDLIAREQHHMSLSVMTYNVSGLATPGPHRPKTVWTDERRAKQRAMMLGNNFSKGLVFSEESRQKCSAAQLGKKMPPMSDERKLRVKERMAKLNRETNKLRPQNQRGYRRTRSD